MNDTRRADRVTQSRKVVRREAHWIEWATGAVSTLLVLAMIGWIVWQAPGAQGSTPELRVDIAETRKAADGYSVSFTVVNDGRRTAAAVPVTARLMDGGTAMEEREVTFDYVPAQSRTSGAVLFSSDPARYRLDIRASGYEDP